MNILEKIRKIKRDRLTEEEIILFQIFENYTSFNLVESDPITETFPFSTYIIIEKNGKIILKYNINTKVCYISYIYVWKYIEQELLQHNIQTMKNPSKSHEIILKFISKYFNIEISGYHYLNYF